MKRLISILAILFVFVTGAVVVGLWGIQQIQQPLTINEPEFITVEHGTPALSVVKSLRQRGYTALPVIVSKIWFKLEPEAGDIRAGTYKLEPGQSLQEVLANMAAGNEFQFTVSLVEGLTLQQWLDALQLQPHLVWDIDDITAFTAQLALPEGMPATEVAEGIFLADTYHFTDGTAVSQLLRRANAALIRYLDSAWAQRDMNLPYQSAYEALVMASIIEKETAVAEERPLIAGVFVNRLEQNMRLQTDPTVIYGLGDTFDGNLTRKHLKQKTAYNTYVIKGLPPTPIAMPGLAAIDAALHPAQTDALYFVARGDGSHHFSSTLEEHNRAVNQYQRNQGSK